MSTLVLTSLLEGLGLAAVMKWPLKLESRNLVSGAHEKFRI